jgi:hypothetical protein
MLKMNQEWKRSPEGESHHGTLTLVLLADFGARDALPCLQARFRAVLLQVLEAFAGFGEVLCWRHLLIGVQFY